jgi:uncharacterized membrane protein
MTAIFTTTFSNFDPIFKITFFILLFDLIWLKLVMRGLFETQVSKIQSGREMRVRTIYAILSYLCMILAIRFLSWPITHSFKDGSVFTHPIFIGFIMGLVMYGVFDFTNLAIFEDYSPKVAALDICWGIALNIAVLYI